MSLYSFVGSDPVPRLFAERESGLNILIKEVLWDNNWGVFFVE